MLRPNADHTFQYELLRVLGLSRDPGRRHRRGPQCFPKIVPGDFESWYYSSMNSPATFDGASSPNPIGILFRYEMRFPRSELLSRS